MVFLKNNAEALLQRFKTIEPNNFHYWKLSHEIYHLLENVRCKLWVLCSDLEKLKKKASRDKELYHMGEFAYGISKEPPMGKRAIHTYLMDIVDRYGQRTEYIVYRDWAIKIKLKIEGTPMYMNDIEKSDTEDYLYKLSKVKLYVEVGKDWEQAIKKLYSSMSPPKIKL
tara:strand:- start:731 stop:1237 length:507 start_codon:yes stop_codon:yes gene_type:complete